MRSILKSMILTIREIVLRLISPFLHRGTSEFSDKNIERILIIRLDGIGDLILSIPAIKALRKRFPSAHITVMTSEATKDLLQGEAYIDEVIVRRKELDLKELSFDLIFDFLDNYALKTALLAYSIKARYRAGFDIKGRGVFFNLKLPQPDVNKHYVDIMLDLAGLVGAESNNSSLELSVTSSEKDGAIQLLRKNNICEGDKIICIHPGAQNWTGRWLPERFAQLTDKLIEQRSAKIVFIGAEYDIKLIDQVRKEVKGETFTYTGRSLRNVAALVQQSDVLVCNNSGLLHIACALHIPTVSTMGPTLPKKWWPVGLKNSVLRKDLPCIGCGKGYCRIKTHDCMREITVEDMFNAVNNQL